MISLIIFTIFAVVVSIIMIDDIMKSHEYLQELEVSKQRRLATSTQLV